MTDRRWLCSVDRSVGGAPAGSGRSRPPGAWGPGARGTRDRGQPDADVDVGVPELNLPALRHYEGYRVRGFEGMTATPLSWWLRQVPSR
jgi:hypothetical protein